MNMDTVIKYWPILALTFASGGTLYAQELKIDNLKVAMIKQVEIRDQVIRLEVRQEELKIKLGEFIIDQKSRWKEDDKVRALLIRYLSPLGITKTDT